MRGSTERRRKGWRKARSKLIVCTWIALLLYINFLLDSLYLSPGLDDPDLNGMALAVQHKQQQQQQQQRPKPRGPVAAVVPSSVGFVHIGKTAGSTLSKLLRNGCHSFVPKPCRVVPNETVVSELVESYYHVPDFWRLPASRHGSYVLSVRDAYERTVSALLYNHPENVAHYLSVHNLSESVKEVQSRSTAYRCFPTLDAFAMLLERGNTTDCDYPRDHSVVDAGNCSELACAVSCPRFGIFEKGIKQTANADRSIDLLRWVPHLTPARALCFPGWLPPNPGGVRTRVRPPGDPPQGEVLPAPVFRLPEHLFQAPEGPPPEVVRDPAGVPVARLVRGQRCLRKAAGHGPGGSGRPAHGRAGDGGDGPPGHPGH